MTGVFWFRQEARNVIYKRVCSPNLHKNWEKINADNNAFAATDVAVAA